MSTLDKHFERIAKHQRCMEDEIHRAQNDGDIENGHQDYMLNLSYDVHAVRQKLERTKFLMGVENERT